MGSSKPRPLVEDLGRTSLDCHGRGTFVFTSASGRLCASNLKPKATVYGRGHRRRSRTSSRSWNLKFRVKEAHRTDMEGSVIKSDRRSRDQSFTAKPLRHMTLENAAQGHGPSTIDECGGTLCTLRGSCDFPSASPSQSQLEEVLFQ